jgi:hypothetical protein
MTAYNAVRFKVKAGMEKAFEEAHGAIHGFKGFQGGALVKTGDRTYCLIGKWDKFDSIIAARDEMIGTLDKFRNMLEDLGGGMGVTDPVSGPAVVEIPATR